MNLLGAAWRFSRNIPGLMPLLLIALEASVALIAWGKPAGSAGNRQREARLAACIVLGFGILDWALLAALPALGLSFGPIVPVLGGLAILRSLILILMLLIALAWQKLPLHRSPVAGIGDPGYYPGNIHYRISPSLAILCLLNLGVLACAVDSLYIEPFNLRTTHLVVTSSGILDRPIVTAPVTPQALVVTTSVVQPLRIVHLSDIHVEHITRREREMIERVRQLQPDLILMTGDYLNIDYTYDPQARADGRAVLSQLSAPYGVYAIAGSPPVDTPESLHAIFDGLNITLLQDEVRRLQVKGHEIYLVGVSLLRSRGNAQVMGDLMATTPSGAYTILLYHTPDLAEAAAAAGVDLYLAGHTHGGQIRLPWYGALTTSSAYGKRFEAGLYQVDQMSLYVSHGIGMEGLRLPRARFLCPPEIIVIDMIGPESSKAGSPSLSEAP